MGNKNTIVLTPVQERIVVGLKGIIKRNNGAVLRGETGTGKTFIAGEIAKDYDRVLVVCEKPEDIKAKLNTINGLQSIHTVVHYRTFGDVAKFNLTGYDFIIFDEAHNLRNYSSAATKRMIRLGTSHTKFLFMSGTMEVKTQLDSIYCYRKCGAFSELSMDEVKIKYFNGTTERNHHTGKFFVKPQSLSDENGFYDERSNFDMTVTKQDIERDRPQIKVQVRELDGEATQFENITEATEARLKTTLAKVDQAVFDIRRTIRDKNISTAVILCHFHDVANKLAKKMGVPCALTKESVASHFFRLQQRGGFLVTTLGLTKSSLDLNECNWVFMVETNYSASLDKQSIDRFDRVGKKEDLNVVYYTLKGEHSFFKSMSREGLLERQDYDASSRIYPSYLQILAECPGSHWFPDRRDVPEFIENAAVVGEKAHAVLERYLSNSKTVSKSVTPEVDYAIHLCRGLKENCKQWGVETRAKWEYNGLTVSGKVDFWCYDLSDDTLYIYDYKNGKTKVKAKDNWQLKAYAVMVCCTLKISPKRVVVGIIQQCKTSEVIYTLSDVSNLEVDLMTIVDNVIDAKEAPVRHIKEGKCSIFCKARQVHEA